MTSCAIGDDLLLEQPWGQDLCQEVLKETNVFTSLQESHGRMSKAKEDIRALDMEVAGIKRSSISVNASRMKLLELLNRIQEASQQTAQKLEQNQAEQKFLEVNFLVALLRVQQLWRVRQGGMQMREQKTDTFWDANAVIMFKN